MASAIDICNLALAHLGEDPTVSSVNPPEGSAHAESCARFYPIARNETLEDYNWPFAMHRVVLALAPASAASTSWLYAYALPSDLIKAIGILQPGQLDEEAGEDFVIEGRILYTNTPEATLRYTALVTDTTKYPPKFVTALSWLLASHLAGAVCDDKNVKQWALQMYNGIIGESAQSQANQRKTVQHHTPSWISAR